MHKMFGWMHKLMVMRKIVKVKWQVLAVNKSWGNPPKQRDRVRFRDLKPVLAKAPPQYKTSKGLDSICASVLGLSPGAIIQQRTVYWTPLWAILWMGLKEEDLPYCSNCGVVSCLHCCSLKPAESMWMGMKHQLAMSAKTKCHTGRTIISRSWVIARHRLNRSNAQAINAKV